MLTDAHAASTALTKVLTGIRGFDEITRGGLPGGRTTLVLGGPGSGKTVFALQALVNGVRACSEPAIFVAFEERASRIQSNAGSFGWDMAALPSDQLYSFDAQLSPETVSAGEFDLVGTLAILEAKALEMGARRIVFDGIDMLLDLLDDDAAERREMYRINDWLVRTGLTGIITQKVSGTDADRRYGFLQFTADCVVLLSHQVVDGSAFRNLRVTKYRGSGFAGDEFPITLTAAGLQLTNRGPTELSYEVSNERVSTGLPRLDHMLHGGYHRGSNVLISGAPGTAKSTLAGLFAEQACVRGERTMYVSFDEGAKQIVRNLRSVGIQLQPHVDSGLLKMFSTRTRGPNIEDQFGDLRTIVKEHDPRCLVVDPLSALSSKMSHAASADAAQQFLDFLKVRGITVVNTSLLDGQNADEVTATGISTIADTWIHMSYVVQDGERNRALTIVKSRGTGHSNQVREMVLTDDGVTLTDVFVAEGKVLMGVARWQWEKDSAAAKQTADDARERRRLHLQLAQGEATARLEVIRSEMAARNAEITLLARNEGSASELEATDTAILRGLRFADDDLTDEVTDDNAAAPSGPTPTRPADAAAKPTVASARIRRSN